MKTYNLKELRELEIEWVGLKPSGTFLDWLLELEKIKKKCTKCGTRKRIEWFYRKKDSLDGYAFWCKSCQDASVQKHRINNPREHKERTSKWSKRYRIEHPEKRAAHTAVSAAKQRGDLIQESCEVCGDKKSVAHHYKGYKQEDHLKVQWLCRKHHAKVHAKTN